MSSDSKLSIMKKLPSLGILIASIVIINTILYFIGTSINAFGPDVTIENSPAGELTLMFILVLSILLPFIGALIFQFFYNSNPETAFRNILILTGIMYLLMFPGPIFFLANTTIGTVILLEMMHIVEAGFFLYFIRNQFMTKN